MHDWRTPPENNRMDSKNEDSGMMKEKYSFPFTGIVGQDAMKKALLYTIIMPSIGGVLIRGEKGTAK